MKISNKELLAYLENTGTWVETSELSDVFGVSPKTISNYVKRINDFQASLILSSQNGYKINRTTVYNKKAPFFNDDLLSRIDFIIKKLSSNESSISIYELADAIFVSDSHFNIVLKHARKKVSSFDLEIVRKRNRISLSGTERNKRKLISSMLQKENYNNFFGSSNAYFESNLVHMEELSKLLANIFGEKGIYINDYNFNTVLIHIAISVERIKNNKLIDFEFQDLKQAEIHSELIYSIKKMLEFKYNIVVSPKELSYLSFVIQNNCNYYDTIQINRNNIDNYINKSFSEKIVSSIKKLETNYLLSPFDDDFIVKIILHVILLKERITNSSIENNLLVADIKTNFPFIFDMSVFLVNEIFKDESIEISDSEIAFLAIHIGSYIEKEISDNDKLNCCVILLRYHNYHTNIMNQIVDNFHNNLNIMTLNIQDVSRIPANTDIIITNSTNLDIHTIPVMSVGNLISNETINDIRNHVNLIIAQKKKCSFIQDLNKFIDTKLFKRNLSGSDREIIEILTREAFILGYCGEGFKNELLERERISPTSFANQIAIPHSLFRNCFRSFLSIVINEDTVDWGDNKVNVILLIGVSETDYDSFKVVLNNILSIVSTNANTQKLRKAASYENFLEILYSCM